MVLLHELPQEIINNIVLYVDAGTLRKDSRSWTLFRKWFAAGVIERMQEDLHMGPNKMIDFAETIRTGNVPEWFYTRTRCITVLLDPRKSHPHQQLDDRLTKRMRSLHHLMLLCDGRDSDDNVIRAPSPIEAFHFRLYNDPASTKIARAWKRYRRLPNGHRNVKHTSHAVLEILENGTHFDALTRLKLDFQGFGFLIKESQGPLDLAGAAPGRADRYCHAVRSIIFKLPALKELLIRLPRICETIFSLDNDFLGLGADYDSQDYDSDDPDSVDRYAPVLPLETLVVNMSLCGEDGHVRSAECGAFSLCCEDGLTSKPIYPDTTPPFVSPDLYRDIKEGLRTFSMKMIQAKMVRLIWPRYLPQWGGGLVAPKTIAWDMIIDEARAATAREADPEGDAPRIKAPYRLPSGYRMWTAPGEIRQLSPDAEWTSKGKLIDYVDTASFGVDTHGFWRDLE